MMEKLLAGNRRKPLESSVKQLAYDLREYYDVSISVQNMLHNERYCSRVLFEMRSLCDNSIDSKLDEISLLLREAN